MLNTKEAVTVDSYSTRLSTKGQIVIPKAMREIMGLGYGDVVEFEIIKKPRSKEKIVTMKRNPSIFDLAGTFKPKNKKPINPVKIREYMEKNYERV